MIERHYSTDSSSEESSEETMTGDVTSSSPISTPITSMADVTVGTLGVLLTADALTWQPDLADPTSAQFIHIQTLFCDEVCVYRRR